MILLPCAFCGRLDQVEDAHIKDEHVLLQQDYSVTAARQGNIIPLCRIHHREYFDNPRRADRVDENREYQFEPKLIIDLENRSLILYESRIDDGTLEGLYNAITTVPMYRYVHYNARREYVVWKNNRMVDRLNFYLYREGRLSEFTIL